MPYIAQYLLKLSISLAVVYLFYVLVLRRLTFYNMNRWYLLGYSLLSFIIPFVNISPFLEKGAWTQSTVVQLIPVMGYAAPAVSGGIDGWAVSLFLLLSGIMIMLTRLLIQYLSFLRIRRSAMLISDDAVKIYQVDRYIIPFSFGRSIFINQHQHKEEELKEIIRHEFIHVKQRHTFDILFGEIMSMLNWYNPFTWFIRHAIRQNLEFIADHQVLKTGLDKKQYQYLLLKVVGTPAFSIANQFNLSSLKKRIAMMNKINSAKVHLIKFLFVLPLITVLLLAFRQAAVKRQPDEQLVVNPLPVEKVQLTEVAIVDTTPVSVTIKKRVDTVPAFREIRIIGYAKKDSTASIVIDASKDGPANPNTIRFSNAPAGMPPLLIVDGVRLADADAGLKNINPNDIESISVLKDASSEAIYGEEGKYGVLLVTTKKGVKITPDAPAAKKDTFSLRATIQIRNENGRNTGLEHFTGLYIVDGVASDSVAIRNINPDDIESIHVIKGKDAEATYGSKGSQGVIIINKKKKDKRITITLSPVDSSASPVTFTSYRAFNRPPAPEGNRPSTINVSDRIGKEPK
jgi:TonB-dependent SusC/RagA subfamily outer membrane receptor